MLMDRFQYVQRVVLKFWQRLRTEYIENFNEKVCAVASTQLTQLLNAVKARTEWLDLLTLKQLKELMHTGKFYELAV
ncbi:hypothetical protein T4D_11401 [Trichinella pseudospiralis]|uniref:Uncharacterized protein n=1 Tax=Trichinella pseudospiralis TaxID=6337 RepID=A0A0V1DNT8_TRIPS|nr:hypothetical protein T4D_11401 [Trichinella pseudospiralis]